MSGHMHILDGGLQTSVQGKPMAGQRHIALPGAGPADPISLALANWCVGNAPDMAGLEITLSAVSLHFDHAATIAFCGAATSGDIDGTPIEAGQSHVVPAGAALRVHGARSGVRSYIAVAGGFDLPETLGGTSAYLPAGVGGHILRAGDSLPLRTSALPDQRTVPHPYRPPITDEVALHCLAGPELDRLDQGQRRAFFSEAFTIGQRANRIGCELSGPALHASPGDIASAAVFPGTIQAPPSGNPFLLGVDAQTTGGYPRIAQIVRADRPSIGQLRPGSRVRFIAVTPARAHELLRRKLLLWRSLMPQLTL